MEMDRLDHRYKAGAEGSGRVPVGISRYPFLRRVRSTVCIIDRSEVVLFGALA